jgi:tetratricopeptide (TPR) repeat protein
LIYFGDKVTATRGYDEGVFPRVVAPRKTKLLNPRPTLLWMPVAGATGYKIIVRGQNARGQNPYWKTDVPSGAKLDYPADAPPLEADTDYKLIVSAGDHQSDEEAEPGLGFALLKSDKAKEARDAEKKIRALGLPDASTRLVIAYLYAAYDLNAEAIEQLEGIPETLQEPAPARLLGALYLAIGLSRRAERHYLRALECSMKANDEEGQAIAHKELGRIYDEALGARNAAIQHFEAALNWYKKLGDRQMARHIEEKLAKRR